MAEYRDFVSNFSNDEKSDWELFDDILIGLLVVNRLETDRYHEFADCEEGNLELVGTVRETYTDECWGQHASFLLGDRTLFIGLTFGPTGHGHCRQQSEQYFSIYFGTRALLISWCMRPIDTLGRRSLNTNRSAKMGVRSRLTSPPTNSIVARNCYTNGVESDLHHSELLEEIVVLAL